MAAFAGLRGTGNWGADERPKDFRETILWTNPNGSAPLTALMAKMKKEAPDDPEFNWWEEALEAVRVTVNEVGGYVSTDTILTIDSGGLYLVPGNTLMIEKAEDLAYTNEILKVTAVNSDTEIVVARGAAGTTPAAIADGAALTCIGSAFAEGTGKSTISQRNPTKKRNYCQIFKTLCGITETAKRTKARTGDAFSNDKKRKMFDHSVQLEFAFMFGKAHEAVGSNGKPERFTGGLRQFIQTNVTIFTSTPDEDDILEALYPVFNYNSKSMAGDERIVLAGNGFLNSLNKVARNATSSRVNFSEIIKVYGMNLQRWITPQGSFGIKTHPLMNLHPLYNYSAFVVDPSNLIYRPLRDTKLVPNVQANDVDAQEDMWLTEAGLELHHEETMAYLGNVVV